MKKIKLFPAPHVEMRISVSDEMKRDMKECRRLFMETGNGADCAKCSWDNVEIECTGFCEYPEVQRQVLEDEDEQIN